MHRAIVVTFVFVAGCAPAAYLEPPAGDSATLRIENQTAAIFGYELEADTYKDAATCTGRLRVADTRALPRGVAYTVRVRTDADFTLTFRGSGGGASRAESCTVAGTFRPVAGERYVAIFRSGQNCELLFAHQQAGGGRRYGREPSYHERFDAPCLGTSAPSSIPAPATAQPPPPGSGAPPVPPLPPR